jgi:hypothetical protein
MRGKFLVLPFLISASIYYQHEETCCCIIKTAIQFLPAGIQIPKPLYFVLNTVSFLPAHHFTINKSSWMHSHRQIYIRSKNLLPIKMMS